MAEKRKDNKGRILKDGESQRKDGRYEYKYKDMNGVRRSIYSWKLVDTDKAPEGKRCKESLRSMIKNIQRDTFDEIDTYTAKNMTVDDLFKMYMDSKTGLQDTTLSIYHRDYTAHAQKYLGHKKISSVNSSDIINTLANVIEVDGLALGSATMVNRAISGMFSLAVKNGYLRTNPQEGAMAIIKKRYSHLESPKREAIEVYEQELFINFLKSKKKYEQTYRIVVFLLGTGCRIGEACGLTWDDCDFDRGVIHIRRTLSYSNVGMGDKYVKAFCLHPTKTRSGTRTIPMFPEVRELLLQEKQRQIETGGCIFTKDGVSGFVFINSKRNAIKTTEASAAISKAVKKYNKQETEWAAKQKRGPVLLPPISAHILRHTFCTRLCECDVRLEVVQKIMGHKNIAMTAEVYNRVTDDRKIDEARRASDKFVIANFTTVEIDDSMLLTTE